MRLEEAEQARNLNAVATSDVKSYHKPEVSHPKTPLILTNGRSRISNNSMAASTSTNGRTNGAVQVSIGTKPTLIEKGPMRFLIMDAPRQSNLHLYIKEMRKNQVTEVVRVCEPTYRGDELSCAGINLHEMEYKDGTSPPKELIISWLQLVEKTFYQSTPPTDGTGAAIAVHCVAGLGRAPVMVAIALIEFAGMDPVESVTFIRNKRRGAINEKQLLYLEGYKKIYKRNGGNGAESSCCVIL
jgi:protein tyrosine phosphatase type IVA